MIKLQDIGSEISFQEDIHEYKNKKGQVLTSVTQCLSLFKEQFDPTGIIAYKCGQREGVSKEEMQARWKKTSVDACVYGTNVHAQVENYLKTKEIKNTPEKDIIEDFSKIKFKGEIFSELRLKSDRFLLAGTCDIANIYKNKVFIHDIKSNKRFDIKSKYSKKLLYPLNHLSDCHLTTYSLQILIYGEMVKEHGFNFEPGQILWIDPDKRKFQKFDVLDLNKEVQDLLNHYKEISNF